MEIRLLLKVVPSAHIIPINGVTLNLVPQITDAQLNFRLVDNIVKDDDAVLLKEFEGLLLVEVVDIEGKGETLRVEREWTRVISRLLLHILIMIILFLILLAKILNSATSKYTQFCPFFASIKQIRSDVVS